MEKLGAGLVVLIAVAMCGCGPSAPRAPEKVPVELVPDGFTQDDCHYIESPPSTDSVAGGSTVGTDVTQRADRPRTERHIACHHHEELKAVPPPTSRQPPRHCSGDDGLIRRCGDEG